MAGNYIQNSKKQNKRFYNPEKYVTGPDPVRRNKYYAYLKHRSQARYRGEDYSLTWEDWETIWQDDVWEKRGKRSDSLCLAQKDISEGWHLHNIEIITRKEQVSRCHTGRRKNA